MIATQYISQYRNAYQIWTKETIFNGKKNDATEKIDLCSKIESYSRELCEINDLLCIVLFMLISTLTIIIVTIYIIFKTMDFNLLTMFTNFTGNNSEETINIVKILASLLLTIMIFLAIPLIFYYLKINIGNPSQSSSIDKMLFELWWKNKCHRCKDEKNRKNMQPIRLYELLDENIKNDKIHDYTPDEKELVKNLTKKKNFRDTP